MPNSEDYKKLSGSYNLISIVHLHSRVVHELIINLTVLILVKYLRADNYDLICEDRPRGLPRPLHYELVL